MKIAMILVQMLLAVPLLFAQEGDILISDFEGADYGQWEVKGNAFGESPAKGTLGHQQEVTGFKGQALLNSFWNGDAGTGVMTSPAFTISRPYINFFVGGGYHPMKTCVELVLVNGDLLFSTTGSNEEKLVLHTWDLSTLQGKEAVVRIVDNEKGSRGHISVDHIVQSDKPLAKLVQKEKMGLAQVGLVRSTLQVDSNYLLLPVSNGEGRGLTITDHSGKFISQFNIRLAVKDPDLWSSFDVSKYKGQKIELQFRTNDDIDLLKLIHKSDKIPNLDTVYQQPYRPQFHYSPRVGWVNDPNGLVYYNGTYHFFYQYNAYGMHWNNMRWGWATSKDLVHWEEHGVAFEMPKGLWAYSGGGVVDWKNTTGLQKGEHPPILLYVTGTGNGLGQHLVYSDDGGKSWKHYSDEPVTRIVSRDPKVFWYKPGNHWVMVIYQGEGSNFNFSKSKDGIHWDPPTTQSFPSHNECPDLFEMKVEGSQETKWVFLSGAGGFWVGDCAKYVVGSFDGSVFKPEQDSLLMDSGRDNYSTQVFSDAPNGRHVFMSWVTRGFGTVGLPGMTANAQFRVPWELSLYRDAAGTYRLRRKPVAELAKLRGREQSFKDVVLQPDKPFQLESAQMELDIEIEVLPAKEGSFSFELSGTKITYDCAAGKLNGFKRSVDLKPIDGVLTFRILVDRTVVELFANDGTLVMSAFAHADFKSEKFKLSTESGKHVFKKIQAYEMNSMWK